MGIGGLKNVFPFWTSRIAEHTLSAAVCLTRYRGNVFHILKAVPAAKVLMLSAHSDDVYVEEATKSGAVGTF
jgi:DNA-binding NarL/FixJ family response regulator